MSWKPLEHGARFVYMLGAGNFGRYRARTRADHPKPEQALRENWMYSVALCRSDTEGVLWVRGWDTKEAKAFMVACVL